MESSEKDIISQLIKSPQEIYTFLTEYVKFDEDPIRAVQLIKKFLFGSDDPKENIEVIKKIQVPIGVCGKIINNYDLLWFCKVCGMTPNSGICQECYSNSNHEGHNAFFKKGYIGVCDCGDPDSWKPSGFCSKHKGYDEKNITVDLLPLHTRTVAPEIFKFLGEKLNYAALLYQEAPETGAEVNDIIKQIMLLFDELTTVSAIFAKLICECLNIRIYGDKPSNHICNFKVFLNEAEKTSYEKDYKTALLKNTPICECKVLENLLKIIHMMDPEALQVFSEYLTKMTKSPLLKDLLGYGILSNYEIFIGETKFNRIQEEEPLEKLALQLFTVDELAYRYLQNAECRDAIIKLTNSMVRRQQNLELVDEKDKDFYVSLFLLKRDMHYFTKPKTMKFLIDSTDFPIKMLNILSGLNFNPIYRMRSTHIENEAESGSQVQPYFDKYFGIICKAFLMNLDFGNLEQCRNIGYAFNELLNQTAEKCDALWENNEDVMFFSTHIQKYFYHFVSSVLYVNLLNSTKKYNELPNEILRNDSREILKKILTKNETDQEIDELIEKIIKVGIVPLLFTIEIRSKKWVNYGGYLDGMNDFYYNKNPTNYVNPDFGLVQLLIGLYKGKDKDDILKLILKLTKKEIYIDWISQIIDNNQVNLIDTEKKKDDLDADKKRIIIEGILHLISSLCSNDAISLLPLIRFSHETAANRESALKIKAQAEQARKYFFIKEAIHYSMKSNNCQFMFHDFLKSLPKKYSKTKGLDILIKEICDLFMNPKGQPLFSAKLSLISHFDPYFYPDMGGISKSLENAVLKFKKVQFDINFGTDMHTQNIGINPMPFNKLFTENIMNNMLHGIITKIIFSQNKLASDTMKMSSFKLIETFFRYAKNNSDSIKTKEFIDNLLINGKEIFQEIHKRIVLNDPQKNSFTSLANKLGTLHKELNSYNESISSLSGGEKSPEEQKLSAKEKQLKIMEELKKKQEKFKTAHESELQKLAPENTGEIVCAICGEHLVYENYNEKPYGRFIFVEKSKNLYTAKIQTLNEEFEKLNPTEVKKMLDIPYINDKGEGLKIQGCRHYAHLECFGDFYAKEAGGLLVILPPELRNLLRYCPLCRTSYTCLMPLAYTPPIHENIRKFAYDSVNRIMAKWLNLAELKEIKEDEYCYKVFSIIAYNLEQIDLIGYNSIFNDIELLRGFLQYCYSNMPISIQTGADKEKALLRLENENDKSFICDRYRVLISKLFAEYMKKGELLKFETLNSIIENEFIMFLSSLLFKTARAKNREFPLSGYNSDLLLASLSKEELFRNSVDFIKKTLIAYFMFAENSEKLYEKIKNIIQINDSDKFYSSVSDFIIPYVKIAEKMFTEKSHLEKLKENLIITIKTLELNKSLEIQLELTNKPLKYKLLGIPTSYREMILKHYQKQCYFCDLPFKEKGLCLKCGTVVCMEFCENDSSLHRGCQGFKNHNEVCQGKFGLYLRMSNGGIVLHYSGFYTFIDSPYLTNFGESMTVTRDQDEDFKLNEGIMQDLIKKYFEDKLPIITLGKISDQYKH